MPNILQDIADEVEQLTDPRQHSEPRWEWDTNRNKKPLPPHITTVPGLIQQLRDLAEPGNDGGEGGDAGAHSVPLRLSATSLLASIEYGAAKRLTDAIRSGMRVERREGAEDCLRALVGLAGQFQHDRSRTNPYRCDGCAAREHTDRPGEEHWLPCHRCQPTTQKELLREVRSWRWQAEIIAGWRAKPRPLPAPCPVCESHGTLVAYAEQDNPRARCTECGEQWAKDPDDHEGHIGVLSEHVIAYGKRVGERRAAARTAAVDERRRQAGAPSRDTPKVPLGG